MPEAVAVIAHIRAKPGMEREVREGLLRLRAPTRKEKGCIHYDLLVSAEDTAVFVFHENWENNHNLDVHLESAHVRGFREQIGAHLADPPNIQRFIRSRRG